VSGKITVGSTKIQGRELLRRKPAGNCHGKLDGIEVWEVVEAGRSLVTVDAFDRLIAIP
jgi:hypothetical protein